MKMKLNPVLDREIQSLLARRDGRISAMTARCALADRFAGDEGLPRANAFVAHIAALRRVLSGGTVPMERD